MVKGHCIPVCGFCRSQGTTAPLRGMLTATNRRRMLPVGRLPTPDGPDLRPGWDVRPCRTGGQDRRGERMATDASESRSAGSHSGPLTTSAVPATIPGRGNRRPRQTGQVSTGRGSEDCLTSVPASSRKPSRCVREGCDPLTIRLAFRSVSRLMGVGVRSAAREKFVPSCVNRVTRAADVAEYPRQRPPSSLLLFSTLSLVQRTPGPLWSGGSCLPGYSNRISVALCGGDAGCCRRGVVRHALMCRST